MAATKIATPVALTIAGSDSSGGAGVQADLKTFTALGVYGASALTALTAQNTQGVRGVLAVPADFIAAQIDAVVADLEVGAVKTGMLGDTTAIEMVARMLRGHGLRPLVVDPVMVATSGDLLLAPDAVAAVRRLMLPLADLLTPNLPEAGRLLDLPIAKTESDMAAHGHALRALGARAVLVKGGHAPGEDAVDILVGEGTSRRFAKPRIATRNTHGSGCTLSAAITAYLARGLPLDAAVGEAKDFVWRAIAGGRDLGIGRGAGPLDHLHGLRPKTV